MKVAVAAFEQETNTFAKTPTLYAHFDDRGEFGKVLRGDDIFDHLEINFGLAGFINAGRGHGFEIVPLLGAVAEPGGTVEEQAFEAITAEIIDRLQAAMPVDAVYLCLHGAMVTDHLEDPEGALVDRIRALVGAQVPIVASFDLHANLSERCVTALDGSVAFRTFPHIDIAETGARTAHLLAQRLRSGALCSAYMAGDFLIPATASGTMSGKFRALYDALNRLEATKPGVLSLSFCYGFNAADVSFAGPTLFGYGTDKAALSNALAALKQDLDALRETLDAPLISPSEAARQAAEHSASGPLVLAEVEDNPGGGSGGDCMDLARALIDSGITDAALGVTYDPEAAAAATDAGVGAKIVLSLGGKNNNTGQPLDAEFTVRYLTQEPLKMTGPMAGGHAINMGKVAVLETAGVQIIVAENRVQCLDSGFFTSVGINPMTKAVIGLKSTLHYQADFAQFAAEMVAVSGSGDYKIDPRRFDYIRLRPSIARWPD